MNCFYVKLTFFTARLADVSLGFPFNLSKTARSLNRSRWALSPAIFRSIDTSEKAMSANEYYQAIDETAVFMSTSHGIDTCK